MRWLGALVVVFVGYVTIVRGYQSPGVPIWDEQYYIVAAQKYLHGVYFQDLHPPLGKLLVAAGEYLAGENAVTSNLLDVTYYQGQLPAGTSMVGYRLIPVLLGWMTIGVVYAGALSLSASVPIATVAAAAIALDNALVLHLRTAMLEGPQLFFVALALLVFIRCAMRERVSSRWLVVLGLAIGAALATKVNAAPLLVLSVGLACFAASWKTRAMRLAVPAVVAAAVVLAVFAVHFSIARSLNPRLQEGGFYRPPSEVTRAYVAGRTSLTAALPALTNDWWSYARWYDRSRPVLDLCRIDETASPWWLWPIGGAAVPYWWEPAVGADKSFRYLYLQTNPLVWLSALLLGPVATAVALARKKVHGTARQLTITLMAMWFAYMALIALVHGVMYLYHYFIPLLLSLLLSAMTLARLPRSSVALGAWAIAAVAAFLFFSPLTYYGVSTPEDLARRNLIPLWDLRCPHCPHTTPLCAG